LLEQAVHVLNLGTGTGGDPPATRPVDEVRLAPFLVSHRIDDGDLTPHLRIADRRGHGATGELGGELIHQRIEATHALQLLELTLKVVEVETPPADHLARQPLGLSRIDLALHLLDERDDIAAFFCEPVIGAGGVYAPPPGYLREVRELCRRHDVLFVADEVITGYGRVGSMFGSERWNLRPDVVLTAKGITSGYVPLGAVLVSGRVAEPFWVDRGSPVMWRHGYTYSAHATACAAALANLDIVEREGLVERVASLQHVLGRALAPLSAYDAVSEVRAGVGLLGAVEFTPDAVGTGMPARVIAGLRERGVLTRTLASGAIQVSPSFVVSEADIAVIAAALEESLRSAGAVRASAARVDPAAPLGGSLLGNPSPGERAVAFDDRYYADQRPPHH